MNSNPDDRRLARVELLEEDVPFLLTDGRSVVDGIPDDGRVVQMEDRPPIHATDCYIRSDEFEVVAEAGTVPTVDVTVDCPSDHMCAGPRITDEDGARCVELTLSTEVFSMLFRDGAEVGHDLPPDTKLSNWWREPSQLSVSFVLTSESFDVVEPGDRPPRVPERFWITTDEDDWDETDATGGQTLEEYLNE